jgi:hypothetical protein
VITNEKLFVGKGLVAPFIKEHQLIKEEMVQTDTLRYFRKQVNQ